MITGLGPVGLAAGALCRKLGAHRIIGIDVSPDRLSLALQLGLCDTVLAAGPDNVAQVRDLTTGNGVEGAVDCSANAEARATAIRATRARFSKPPIEVFLCAPSLVAKKGRME